MYATVRCTICTLHAYCPLLQVHYCMPITPITSTLSQYAITNCVSYKCGLLEELQCCRFQSCCEQTGAYSLPSVGPALFGGTWWHESPHSGHFACTNRRNKQQKIKTLLYQPDGGLGTPPVMWPGSPLFWSVLLCLRISAYCTCLRSSALKDWKERYLE